MTDSDPDNTYRPRSPDISSFQGSYTRPPYIDQYTHQPGYSPLSHPTTPQASYDASPFFNRQQYFPPQPQHQAYPYDSYQPQEMPPITRSMRFRSSRAQSYTQEHQPHYMQTHHTHPPQVSHPQPLQHHHQQQQQQQAWHPPPAPDAGEEPPPKVAKTDLDSHPAPAPPAASGPGPSQGIEIKTKFPVARIKRIMQADEDVGKVAQVTPVAVSKALELFMITLVTRAAEQAKARSSKRITATHLKEAVLKDEHFDFLHEIMSKVPDQQSKKDDEGSDHNDGRKRRGGGGGRRRKDDHGDE